MRSKTAGKIPRENLTGWKGLQVEEMGPPGLEPGT